MDFKNAKYILSVTLIFSDLLTQTTAAYPDPITLNNSCVGPGYTNSACATQIAADSVEPYVLELTQAFEKSCRDEAAGTDGDRVGAINFTFHKENFTIAEILSSVNRVTLTGPFQFNSPGPTELLTNPSGRLTGNWTIIPTGVTTQEMSAASYIQTSYVVYDSYISSVDVSFYVLPGTTCSSISDINALCPNAKTSFHSAMLNLKAAINLRNPSPSLSDPIYNFPGSACTAMTKPDLSGAITSTPYALVNLPPTTTLREYTGY